MPDLKVDTYVWNSEDTAIFCGKMKIAELQFSYKGKTVVALRRGISQKKIIERIIKEVPAFAEKYNISINKVYSMFG